MIKNVLLWLTSSYIFWSEDPVGVLLLNDWNIEQARAANETLKFASVPISWLTSIIHLGQSPLRKSVRLWIGEGLANLANQLCKYQYWRCSPHSRQPVNSPGFLSQYLYSACLDSACPLQIKLACLSSSLWLDCSLCLKCCFVNVDCLSAQS